MMAMMGTRSGNDDVLQTVTDTFTQVFGSDAAIVVRAPGRVNLIGDHTDYNDGFVLPMAIDRGVWIALRPRDDRTVKLHLLDFDQETEFSLDDLSKGETSPLEYIKGVAWALQDEGLPLQGWEGVIGGDVPIGAGLSSSAALELATARAFAAVSNFAWNPKQMALAGQKAENKWVGVNTGIMDQMISASGRDGAALLIDCRSLETEVTPIPDGASVVVLDSSTRRGLVGSAYDERRRQCESAARFFNVPALRDLTPEMFEARAYELDDVTRRRARHVINENAYTLEAKAMLQAGDAASAGKLMNLSHESLRDDFEISTPAMNAIVACAQIHTACYGARMTGGGFGGAAVALVKSDEVADFVEHVKACYFDETGNTAQVYVCRPTQGAEVIKP